MANNFEFKKPESISPKRVGIVINRFEKMMNTLEIDPSTLEDLSEVDTAIMLSIPQMNEAELAKQFNEILDSIEQNSLSDEGAVNAILSHKPLRAIYRRALEMQEVTDDV